MKAYRIHFKVGKRAYKWERFAESREALEAQLKVIFDREYDGKAKVLAIGEVYWSEVHNQFFTVPQE